LKWISGLKWSIPRPCQGIDLQHEWVGQLIGPLFWENPMAFAAVAGAGMPEQREKFSDAPPDESLQ
jgi:hypothetical protein